MEIKGFVQAGSRQRPVTVPENWDKGRICLTVYQVAFLINESVTSVWRHAKTNPRFPRPHEVSSKRTVWFSDEVAQWLAATPKSFGEGAAFRKAVWNALKREPYRKELLSFCVRAGVLTKERLEQHLTLMERDRKPLAA